MHISWRTYTGAPQIEGAFDNLDRAVNPRAEPAWICQDEGFWRLSCFALAGLFQTGQGTAIRLEVDRVFG